MINEQHSSQPNDEAARMLLRAATERNYHWPPEVAGFAATVHYRDGEHAYAGHVDAPGPRDLRLDLPQASAEDVRWCETELRSLVGHRLHRTFEQGDGRYGITAEPQGAHPFGQLIRLHGDPNQSSYRVADGMLREANRTAGQRHFTLSVHAVKLLGQDQYIAQHYSVLHFANDGGQLIRADVYTDDYTEVEGVWLPVIRRVVAGGEQGLRARELVFSQHVVYRTPLHGAEPETYDQLRAKRQP